MKIAYTLLSMMFAFICSVNTAIFSTQNDGEGVFVPENEGENSLKQPQNLLSVMKAKKKFLREKKIQEMQESIAKENKVIVEDLKEWSADEGNQQKIILKIVGKFISPYGEDDVGKKVPRAIRLKKISGGFFSGAVYQIFIDDQLTFIFKEIKQIKLNGETEPDNLRRVAQASLLRDLPYGKYPKILRWTFQEKVWNGVEIDPKFGGVGFALIHVAKGSSFKETVKKIVQEGYREEANSLSDESLMRLDGMFGELGYSLGVFHKYISEKKDMLQGKVRAIEKWEDINSIRHGDLNDGNLFVHFSEKNSNRPWTFYAIDTESAHKTIPGGQYKDSKLVDIFGSHGAGNGGPDINAGFFGIRSIIGDVWKTASFSEKDSLRKRWIQLFAKEFSKIFSSAEAQKDCEKKIREQLQAN